MNADANGRIYHATNGTKSRLREGLAQALGPVIAEAMADPDVTDVLLNADGSLWVMRHSDGRRRIGELSADYAETAIRMLATHMGTEVTQQQPMVTGVLPGTNARFQGVLPPVSKQPVFAIRKHTAVVHTLEDFVSDRILSETGADLIRTAIEQRDNLLITGGTGSGKTTLANACLAVPALCRDRIVLIEDTRELQCSAIDLVELVTQPMPATTTMEELVKTTLRLFPGRIVIGEVRGPEALAMIKAWGTGHPGGLCTLHANGPHDALYRLEDLIGEVAARVPRRTIARAIDLIVHIERSAAHPAGRRVTGMARPRLGKDDCYIVEDLEL